LSAWQSECQRYFNRIINDPNGNTKDAYGISSFLTKGGLLYYPTDSGAASLNPALNLAKLIQRYQGLGRTSQGAHTFTEFAAGQVAYTLGINPMNVPYVVGLHPNSPLNPHSAQASGGNNINDIDHSPPTEAYVLYGAMVGGPDSNDQFYDERGDYDQTEVALDYNAPLISIAAFNVLNESADPPYVVIAPGTRITPTRSSGGLSTGAKVGIAFAVIIIIVAFGALLWFKRESWFNRRGRGHYYRTNRF